MELYFSIFLILSALLAGAVSPGPSFILVARIAMGISRGDGVAAAIGMGAGGVIFSVLALMGLQAVLIKIPVLYLVLKIFGGLYLIYIAIRIWRGAGQTLMMAQENVPMEATIKRSFFTGLFTQLSNPKTALVYAGIFAALLPMDIPAIIYFILPPLVFLLETGWYVIIALILSAERPRSAYLKTKSIFDRIAGFTMASLGLKLISSGMND